MSMRPTCLRAANKPSSNIAATAIYIFGTNNNRKNGKIFNLMGAELN